MDSSKKIFCDPCQFEGKSIDASTVCKQCREFYCEECKYLHFKFQVSRDHVLASINVLNPKDSKLSPKLRQREIPASTSRTHRQTYSRGKDVNGHTSSENKSIKTKPKESSNADVKNDHPANIVHEKTKDKHEKRVHKISTSEREEMKKSTAHLHEKIDSLKH